ncbi:MAG: hypothetical protein FJW88_02525 [Actinobacteria bacterium]|nr:hypothetical protein [Actinomycetota bacterium]
MEPTVRRTVVETARYWWIVLLVGVAFVIFGTVMLFDVKVGAQAVGIIVGAFLIFDGLVELISGGRGGGSRAVAVILGLILAAGGVVVIVWPGVTFWVIAVVLGITMIVGAIGRVVASIWLRDGGWGLRLALGVVEGVVGVAILVWPRQTAYVILLLIGCYAILSGIIQIVLAFEIKRGPTAVVIDEISGPGGTTPAF